MAIYTQEYKKWKGTYRKRPYKVWGMILFGVKRAWSNNWVKVCLILGWIPAIFFIVLSVAMSGTIQEGFQNPGSFYTNYFSFQLLLIILFTAVAGSSLISEDIKNKSITLYYSSPLKKIDYILGKLGIIVALLSLITVVPSTVMYWSLTLTLDSEIQSTLWVWGSCILSSFVLTAFFSILILFLSSLTGNNKYAGASFFGLILGSDAVAAILYVSSEIKWAVLISLLKDAQHIIGIIFRLQPQEIGAMEGEIIPWYYSFGIIVGLTILLGGFTYLKLRKMELSE